MPRRGGAMPRPNSQITSHIAHATWHVRRPGTLWAAALPTEARWDAQAKPSRRLLAARQESAATTRAHPSRDGQAHRRVVCECESMGERPVPPQPLPWDQVVDLEASVRTSAHGAGQEATAAVPALDFAGRPAAVAAVAEANRLSFGDLSNDAFAAETAGSGRTVAARMVGVEHPIAHRDTAHGQELPVLLPVAPAPSERHAVIPRVQVSARGARQARVPRAVRCRPRAKPPDAKAWPIEQSGRLKLP